MKTGAILILNMGLGALLMITPKIVLGQSTTIHVESTVNSGKVLFEQLCSKCHGDDGAKGRFGAKNLQQSILTDEQYLRIILKGKGIMPSWEKRLTSEQITEIIKYIKEFRK